MYESIPPKGSHLQLQWHARHLRSFDRHPPPIKVQGRCTALNPDCSTPYVLQLRSRSRYPIYPSTSSLPFHTRSTLNVCRMSSRTWHRRPSCVCYVFPSLIQSIVRHCEHTHAISHRLHTPWCFPESERPFHHWSHYIEANTPSRICTQARSNNWGRKNQSWAWKGPHTNCFLR